MTRHRFVPAHERHGAPPVDPLAPFYAALGDYFEAEDRALLAAFGFTSDRDEM